MKIVGLFGVGLGLIGAILAFDAITGFGKGSGDSKEKGEAPKLTVNYGYLLQVGSSGDAVKKVQTALNYLGYSVGPTDGIFGAHTEAGVIAFQSAEGLQADGIVGNTTYHALNMELVQHGGYLKGIN